MLTYDLTARGRKTMYEYLYEAMKADILSGRLAAGFLRHCKQWFEVFTRV